MNERKLPPLWKQKILWKLAELLNVNIRIYPNREYEPKDKNSIITFTNSEIL